MSTAKKNVAFPRADLTRLNRAGPRTSPLPGEAFFGLADAVPLRSIGPSLSSSPCFYLSPVRLRSPSFSLFLSVPLPRSPRARPIDITFSVRSEKHRMFLPRFLAPRWSHSLFLTTRSLFFYFSLPPFLSCQETFYLLSSSLFPSPNAHFLRSYLGSLSHLPLSSPLPFCHTTTYIRIRSSLFVVRQPVSLSPTCFFLGPAASTVGPVLLSHPLDSPLQRSLLAIFHARSFHLRLASSRRRLAEIFSLLPSRNEQCGGSGMQDGRRTLEPRATRTLLRVDGNERDVTRIRGTSSGPEKENKKERERERVRRGRGKGEKRMRKKEGVIRGPTRKRATRTENKR